MRASDGGDVHLFSAEQLSLPLPAIADALVIPSPPMMCATAGL
jgi:hypothetical protein